MDPIAETEKKEKGSSFTLRNNRGNATGNRKPK